MIENLITN